MFMMFSHPIERNPDCEQLLYAWIIIKSSVINDILIQ